MTLSMTIENNMPAGSCLSLNIFLRKIKQNWLGHSDDIRFRNFISLATQCPMIKSIVNFHSIFYLKNKMIFYCQKGFTLVYRGWGGFKPPRLRTSTNFNSVLSRYRYTCQWRSTERANRKLYAFFQVPYVSQSKRQLLFDERTLRQWEI